VGGVPFDDAVARAMRGDAALGISGIGVPLIGLTGERAAAFVLPTGGHDLRRELGDGHAIVFIARRGEQQPLAIEILRTVFGLTPMEARIAYATSQGDSGPDIAAAFGTSLETVRTHLKQVYLKVDVPGKLALAVRINALLPPVETGTRQPGAGPH
jgi:DNA-binding CsgD family transcriptional regulator